MNKHVLLWMGICSLTIGVQAARSSAMTLNTTGGMGRPTAAKPSAGGSLPADAKRGDTVKPQQATSAQTTFKTSLTELEKAMETEERKRSREDGIEMSAVPKTNPGTKSTRTTVPSKPPTPKIEPADNTVFEKSLTVNVWCDDPGARIHMTTNGTDPTTSSPLYHRFRVYDKSIVKVAAETANGSLGPITTARYAHGTCPDPVISPADGTKFQHSGNTVTITCQGTDGTLHYTLDGSEPTQESPVYTAPFSVDDNVVVKAKVISDRFFDSHTSVAAYTREWITVGTPVVKIPATFSGSKSIATITGEENSTFRYTLDGTDPNSDSALYDGPFEVTSSATIKVRAYRNDCRESAVASASTTKIWCLGDALNDSDRTFTTNSVGWIRDTAVSKDGHESLRSISPGNSKVYGKHVRTSLSTTVTGKGTMSFWWKTSCEKDDLCEWDHAEFSVDGKTWKLDGISDWQLVEHVFETEDEHVLTWSYLKDDFGTEGEDCVWVDMFTWTPAE